MLYADALRGWDATGVFGVDKLGNVDIKKQAAAAGHFLNTTEYDKFDKDIISKYRMVVGHNRKATHGLKRHEDSHPFWDETGKICLVHNGMISNHKEFCKESTVDSAAIANALATDTAENVIGKIEGAFAFIWFNTETKELNFIRNDKRPLFICETDSNILLVSEQAMAFWICNRNAEKVVKMSLCEENTLYTLPLGDKVIGEGVKIEPPKKHSAPITIYAPASTTVAMTNRTNYRAQVSNDDLSAPDTYFLSDGDFLNPEKALELLSRRDRIHCLIDSYELPKGEGRVSVLVNLRMNNVDRDWLEIRMYIAPSIFDQLDTTCLLSVEINNISNFNGKVTIYVSNPEEHEHKVTINEQFISDSMWFDERFPTTCDTCNQENIKWKDLKDCNIWVEDKTVVSAICPKCSGVHTHAV